MTNKGELRASAIHEVGARLDDMQEATQHELHRREGGVAACVEVSKKIGSLIAVVDKELDEGQYDIDTAKRIKQALARAVAVSDSRAREEDNARLRATGALQAMQKAVEVTSVLYQGELAKMAAHKERDDSALEEDSGPRPVGAAPKKSIKQRRLEEEAAQQQAAAPKPEEPKPAPTKRRTTKKAAKKPKKPRAQNARP